MCRESGRSLLIGADTNAHSSLWSDIDENNARGNDLEELIMEFNLKIHNSQLEKPTFVNRRCNTVIDLTLTMNGADRDVAHWRVADDVTHSDHKMIRFHLDRAINIKEKIMTRKLEQARHGKVQQDSRRQAEAHRLAMAFHDALERGGHRDGRVGLQQGGPANPRPAHPGKANTASAGPHLVDPRVQECPKSGSKRGKKALQAK